ncbi:MAG: hypothetical protein KGZ92_07300 [Firmicutes bacterium]|nr:hypothetical protein [Dethiobacter sp.]MBS3889080.1 hypothetical protein [Bacillota bacterium]
MEKVLVVTAEAANNLIKGEGLIRCGEESLAALSAVSLFLPRDEAEGNPHYRQLIPYVVVVDALSRIFACTRLATQSEVRLHSKVSLGVGGHINPTDGPLEPAIVRRAAWRELHEELHVSAENSGELVFCGLINDLSTPVSRDHLGCLLILKTQGQVSVREKDKMTGEFVREEVLLKNMAQLESWSSLCLLAFRELEL